MKEQELLFSVLKHIQNPVAVYNDKLQFVFVNEAFAGNAVSADDLISKSNADWCRLNNCDISFAEKRNESLKEVLASGIDSELTEADISDIHNRYRRFLIRGIESGQRMYLLMQTVPDPLPVVNEDHLDTYSQVRAQELTNTGSWQFFAKHCFTVLSPGAARIFGLFAGMMPATESLLEMVITKDRKLLRERLLYTLETGEESTSEVVILVRNIRKTVIIRSQRILLNDASYALTGSVADISPVKKTEDELQSLEEHLSQVSELARSGSFEYIVQGSRLEWSTGLFRIFEKDPASGSPTIDEYYKHIHPDDRRIAEGMLSSYALADAEITKDIRILTWRGNDKHIQVVTKPHIDDDGRIQKIIGSIADISNLKLTEARLRLSEQHLLEAQQMSRSGSWELNLTDRSVIWSAGVYRILGLSSRRSVSVDEFNSWIDESDRERVLLLTKALREGHPFEAEYTLHVPQHPPLIIMSRGKAIQDADGSYRRAIGTITDVTPQAQVRKALQETKRQTDEMMRAKEYFLANISHELKTPLNGILGMARLLQKTELNTTQRNYIDVLNSTAGNLLVIINDILDIAKIESGTISLEQIPFDPLKIADTAVQIQLYKAEEKDIVLRHLHVGAPLPPVLGDPYRLSQILLNLLNNAIKFTNEGEVELTHRIAKEEEGKVWIEFSVKDTGMGIAADKHESVFESFMQAHEDHSGQYGGTGLGLTISRNLVELQGGTIHVESAPGEGSRFYFSIPYELSGALNQDNTIDKGIDLKKLGSLRILLAEDNRVNQFITEAMLLDWGFRVDIAVNGVEAVEMVRKSDYDLILMDIQMPEMNGSEAAKVIRAFNEPRKSKVPIIALTANTSRQAHRKFISDGMNDCLVKPFKEEVLFKRIIAQLEGDERIKLAITRPRFPVRRKPVPSGEQLYNLSLLKRDARDNPVFIRKMLLIFIDSIPPIIDRMREQFEKGEMDAIAGLAHKIKPTIDGAGIVSLWDTIRNMENYREKKRSREQMRSDLQQLDDVIKAVVNSFRKELETLEINS